MSVSRGLYRTSGRQLQFAGPWARGRLTRTTGRGYAQVLLHPLQEPPHLPAGFLLPVLTLFRARKHDSSPATDWSKVTRLDTPRCARLTRL